MTSLSKSDLHFILGCVNFMAEEFGNEIENAETDAIASLYNFNRERCNQLAEKLNGIICSSDKRIKIER